MAKIGFANQGSSDSAPNARAAAGNKANTTTGR